MQRSGYVAKSLAGYSKTVWIVLYLSTCICYSQVDNVQEYQKIVDAEWEILYTKLEHIHKSGAKVVLSKLPIGR